MTKSLPVCFGCALVLASVSAAYANPVGAPVSEVPPLSCSTPSYTVEAIAANGTFPIPSQCSGEDQPCGDYGYKISSKSASIENVVFAVSASQNLFGTSGAVAHVMNVGTGDSPTGFLAFARHEYAVRFDGPNVKSSSTTSTIQSSNSSGGPRSLTVHLFTSGASKARISTALIHGGSKHDDSDQHHSSYVRQSVRDRTLQSAVKT